jgi:regulator of sigma E protease
MNLILSQLIISLAILFHELGHFFTMRLFKLPVRDLTIGIGPTYTLFNQGGTAFRIAPILFGGYVRYDDTHRKYVDVPAWQQLLVALAGPAASVGLTLLALFAAGLLHGAGPLDAVRGGWHIFTLLLERIYQLFAHQPGDIYRHNTIKGNYTFMENATLIKFCVQVSLLSISVAIFNMLPVLPFDGGRVVIAGYQLATGRRANSKLITCFTIIGILIVLSLLVAGFYNDVFGPKS